MKFILSTVYYYEIAIDLFMLINFFVYVFHFVLFIILFVV